MPRPLEKGDRVRIVAPSGAFDQKQLDPGLELIERAGLVPLLDDGIFARSRYLAGDDARRGRELAQAIADRDVRAIWAARGGYGATRLLPALDLDAVAANPKWLVGFSDVTALHAVWRRAGLASLHGANVTTLGGWGPEARESLWDILFRAAPHTLAAGRWLTAAQTARGTLFGGNLTVLGAMAGTGHLPSAHGCIVLLEDIGEQPYRLDRVVTQLLQARFFEGVVAVVLGQLSGCVDKEGSDAALAIAEALAPTGLPVAAGLPVGHDPSSFPVLLGARATLDVSGQLVVEAS